MDDTDALDGAEMEQAARTATAAEAAARAASTSRSAIARAGFIVTGLFLVSRILGYVRTVAIAASVPDVGDLGPFFAAFRIPDFLFQLVAAGALSSALIPVVASLFATDEEARAWRVVSTVTTLMLSALVLLAGVVLLFTPGLVAFIAPGFDAAELAQTTELTRIMVLSPMFLAAGSVATSVLNARGRFAASGVAPLMYNLMIIVGALALVPVFGTAGLAYGVVLGAAGHILVQVPSLWRIGAGIRPRLDLGDDQARLALLLMVPRAIGLGATQLVFLVMTSLATTLGDEALAVFNFAFPLLQIPIGVIGVPLGVVLLPSLSRVAATGATDEFQRLLVRGLSILAYVMIGIAALGIIVSEDIVRLLFGFAHIGEDAIELTSLTLAVFLLGLTAHSLIAVLARAFYALKDTRTPVIAALIAVVINIVVANALVGMLGLQALAAAIAIAAWLETIALVILLERRLPGLRLRHVWVVMAKSLVVSLAGAALAFGLHQVLLGAWGEDPGLVLLFVRTCVTVGLGGAVVLAGSLALRISELRTIVDVVVDLLRRRGRA
ncbi:MAG: murein biosynthesis integral membrane protein MurJ [Chloroflexota bacterium]